MAIIATTTATAVWSRSSIRAAQRRPAQSTAMTSRGSLPRRRSAERVIPTPTTPRAAFRAKSWKHDDQLYLRQQRVARPADGVQRRLDHLLRRQPDEVLRRKHFHMDAGAQTGDGQGRQHEHKLYLRHGRCSQQQDRGLDEV